jgi:hypothetical protein
MSATQTLNNNTLHARYVGTNGVETTIALRNVRDDLKAGDELLYAGKSAASVFGQVAAKDCPRTRGKGEEILSSTHEGQ